MDKENARRFFAIVSVLFLFLMYKEMAWDPFFHPDKSSIKTQIEHLEEEKKKEPTSKETRPEDFEIKVSKSEGKSEEVDEAHPQDNAIKKGGEVSVSTKAFTAKISLLGGRITEFRLKDFKETGQKESPLYNVVSHTNFAPYPLGVYSGNVSDVGVSYSLSASASAGSENSFEVGEKPLVLTLSGSLPDGRSIAKTITFYETNYLFDLSVRLGGAPQDNSDLTLEWTRYVEDESHSLLDPYNVSSFVWFDGNKVSREHLKGLLDESKKNGSGGETVSHQFGKTAWASIGDKYFMFSFLSQDGLSSAAAIKTGPLYRLRFSGDETKGSFKLFAGPKKMEVLEPIAENFRLNIDFGMFGIIAVPLLGLLHGFFHLFGNYAPAIVLLTIIVKLALYPLNSAAYRSMREMQKLAPEMKRLRDTVTDRQQQQMQMMELYKKHGVNPFGGCLPMIAQMPIFIGLYSALMVATELRHSPFAFWIHDLSAPEKLMIAGSFGIPVMVILMVISMLVQQWMTPAQDPQQKKVMMFMPFIFGFMFAGFPAGLTLYWLTNNIISIVQQKAMTRATKNTHGMAITLAASVIVFTLVYLMTLIG